ncbi:hypothetical protein JNW91_01530 [Micromonospora sp. STR1_7]|uniref:Uncharacterized protein n=1 Tax=Micromonospora parastrephiae TaxID=2806101 RepID=A0ABS1XN37_9ACTN|nr:hypothetical protein [Micromonospora parastrephiae]
MPGHVEVVDAVRAGDHPGHDRGHLAGQVRALVRRQAHPLSDRVMQTGLLGQAHHRNQAGTRHQIRIIEDHGRHRRVIS